MQGSELSFALFVALIHQPVENDADAVGFVDHDAIVLRLLTDPRLNVGEVDLAQEGFNDQRVDFVLVHAVDSRNLCARFKRESRKTFG